MAAKGGKGSVGGWRPCPCSPFSYPCCSFRFWWCASPAITSPIIDGLPPSGKHRHPLVRFLFLAIKNLVGIFLILIGIAMLVLPGQGLLTIFLGIILVDIRGKYRLERWLVGKRPVLRSINWLRRRAGHPALRVKRAKKKT